MTDLNRSASILESESAPACDVYHAFAHTVNGCMRQSGFTRKGLASRMNEALEALEVQVDEVKLNKWFAPSQPNHMPIHYLPALLWALQSIAPANALLLPLLFSAVDQRAKMLQRHGQLQIEIEERKHMQQDIQSTLLGNGHE